MEHAPRKRRTEFRFYEELNDFLPEKRRKRTFPYEFHGTPAVKDAIEALGVPHSAVDVILVDGEPATFGKRLEGGERVAVYPTFERLDVSPLNRLRPAPLRETRFILDAHLGRLARYLRMLGFDAAYASTLDDQTIIRRSRDERRIILTRDLGILKHGSVTHGYFVRSTDPEAQLKEVVRSMHLKRQMKPFTRCMVCNGRLATVDVHDVRELVPRDVADRFDRVRRCEHCERVYWRGSHFERMEQLIDSIA